MSVVIEPYSWMERGECYRSDFFPFVNGEPRFDITCRNCMHFRGGDVDCVKATEVGEQGDDKIYPFCGVICGYFTLNDEVNS
jgi:hypothetical protein